MSPYALSEAERKAIAPHGVPRAYPKGAVVVSEGDNTDSLYVILEGRVKIYASDQDGHEDGTARQRDIEKIAGKSRL